MRSRQVYGKHNYSDIDSDESAGTSSPLDIMYLASPLQCKPVELLMSNRTSERAGWLAPFPDWVLCFEAAAGREIILLRLNQFLCMTVSAAV